MTESALSFQDAWDAGIRFRLVESNEGLRVSEGSDEDFRVDMEQVLHLVRLALESGRAVRMEGVAIGSAAGEMV